MNDYPVHIFEVSSYEHLEYFKTDLKLVFGFLKNRKNPEGLKLFCEKNEIELSEMEEDAYDMVASISQSNELMKIKPKVQKGGTVNMCEALQEWMRSCKMEGHAEGCAEGEARFASLTERLLQECRTKDLLKATGDKGYRENLYKEYRL